MSTIIREMTSEDKHLVMDMMDVFYASPAVSTNGSEKIFIKDIENCVGECPYLEGYVFEQNHVIQGYAMVAKSFSTEFGKPCIWIEDLYIKKEYRDLGIGSQFFRYIEEKYADTVLRLEVDKDNERAIKVYEKHGYKPIGYLEMKKIND
ncbi:MAG: N-acetyltransferase [Clostridiales bacterium]|nr:N-acetyltransferase [Clostridiales bacterium]